MANENVSLCSDGRWDYLGFGFSTLNRKIKTLRVFLVWVEALDLSSFSLGARALDA